MARLGFQNETGCSPWVCGRSLGTLWLFREEAESPEMAVLGDGSFPTPFHNEGRK